MVTTLYSKAVILRMFNERELAEFEQRYEEAKLSGQHHSFGHPTDKDFLIYQEYKRGMNLKQLKSRFGLGNNAINSAIIRGSQVKL